MKSVIHQCYLDTYEHIRTTYDTNVCMMQTWKFVCMHACMHVYMYACLFEPRDIMFFIAKSKTRSIVTSVAMNSFQPRCWCQLQMRIHVRIFFYFLCIYVLRIYFYISTFILHVTSSQFCLHLFIFATSIIYVHMHIYTRTHTSTHTRTHVWLAHTRRTASQAQELCWQGRK